ncbi:thioredoxin-like protein [Radiomyces spectabilis]|uniref:thioredoxin-like protein n=1 Tax=Radiomyces spectabilis TaxID=64574 RepID=UPI00222103B3|nr:thioredoxin-like protein [Radiomyces spectabilis]KAI8379672.1 thioredoxin-like protein [Radiomyces spectabilis]
MNIARFVCFLLLACAALAVADIVQITDENFDTLVKKSDEWVLEFFGTNCGACRAFQPKFEAVERIMSSHGRPTQFGTIDYSQNPGLSARFFVSRIPTVVHIKDHQVRPVTARMPDMIVKFLENEEWRDVKPSSGLLSPYSLFGTLVGYIGKATKWLTQTSPWGMVGLLTGLLIAVVGLSWKVGGNVREEVTRTPEDRDPAVSSTTTASPALPQEKARKRRSKRND